MKYTLLGFVVLIALGVLVFYVAAAARRGMIARRNDRREAARRRATWTDTVTMKDGRTQILVQKIARDGNWSEVMDQQFVGQILDDHPDYDEELHKMWREAMGRVYLLNTGPLM